MRARALMARHLLLDPSRVLLELERVDRELDDPLLVVERVLAPDVDVALLDLDQVVAGPRMTPEAKRGNRARVDDEDVLQPPGVRHVLVSREHEVDARPLERLEGVAGVIDDVALAAGAGHGQQMMVEREDAEVGVRLELLADPRVAAAADVAVVEIRLGRVDRDDGNPVDVHDGVALAEELLEMEVTDVARVVVTRDDDQLVAVELVQVRLRFGVLLAEAERG